MPNVEEIRVGIDAIMQSPQSASKYKDLTQKQKFDDLIGALNAWLENNECDTVNNRQLIAQVIKQYFTGEKFSFGKPPRIAEFSCASLAVTILPAGPVYTDLTDSWAADKGKFTAVRRDVARVLGIQDKGHAHHGSNFSGQQTLKQIIQNLFAGVQGDKEQGRVRDQIHTQYGFTV